jgi:hypothetical protein
MNKAEECVRVYDVKAICFDQHGQKLVFNMKAVGEDAYDAEETVQNNIKEALRVLHGTSEKFIEESLIFQMETTISEGF